MNVIDVFIPNRYEPLKFQSIKDNKSSHSKQKSAITNTSYAHFWHQHHKNEFKQTKLIEIVI